MKKLFFILFFLLSSILNANNLPVDWPWKGINIELVDVLPVSEGDIKYFTEIGFNVISVSIKTRQLCKKNQKDPYLNLRAAFNQIHILLEWCKKYDCKLIITHSNFPMSPKDDTRLDSHKFWNNIENTNEILNVAELISSEFKNYGPELGAYKIMAEPLIRDGNKVYTPAVWNKFIKQLVSIVRKNDKDRYVYVTSGPGGSGGDFSRFKPLEDKHIIYGFHFYRPHAYTHQGIHGRTNGVKYPGLINMRLWDKEKLEQSMKAIINFKNKYSVPIFVGEFSVINGAKGEIKYLADALEIFEHHSFGWAYWCYNGYHGWNIHKQRKDFNSPYIQVSNMNSLRMKLLEKYGKDKNETSYNRK